MDLYPEILFAEGYARKRGIMARLLDTVEIIIFSNAKRIIVLGQCVFDELSKKMSGHWDKLVLNPIGSVGDLLPIEKKDNLFLKEHGKLKNKLIIMYSGNMGLGHDMQTILEGNNALKPGNYHFVFVGDGKRKDEVCDWIKNNQDLATILPYQPLDILAHSLSAADIHIVTMRQEYRNYMVPSKFFGALNVGRPVLFVGPEDSDVGIAVKEYHCGLVVPNGSVDKYREYLETLINNRPKREKMCENALKLARTKYRSDDLRKRTAEIIEQS